MLQSQAYDEKMRFVLKMLSIISDKFSIVAKGQNPTGTSNKGAMLWKNFAYNVDKKDSEPQVITFKTLMYIFVYFVLCRLFLLIELSEKFGVLKNHIAVSKSLM